MSADSFDTQYANALPIERATLETIAARTLLHDLNVMGFETAQCQHVHRTSPCSVVVTHRAWSCTDEKLVCANDAARIDAARQKPNITCKSCLLPLADCWNLRVV